MNERLIEELKVLRLRADETLVIQSERILSAEDMEWLRSIIDKAGVKAIVLEPGFTVGATIAAPSPLRQGMGGPG